MITRAQIVVYLVLAKVRNHILDRKTVFARSFIGRNVSNLSLATATTTTATTVKRVVQYIIIYYINDGY